jgi:hypothetical protein
MKTLFLGLFTLVVAGCSGSNGTDFGPSVDEFGCAYDCGGHVCPDESICISAPYEPTCVQSCLSGDDCQTGKCIVIFGNEGRGGVCSPGTLQVCHQPDCSMIQPMCRDAMTQLKPLAKTSSVCGWELVRCDNGCDSATGSCN